ncbi:hypothetical protein M413DRAFT_159352 [Hebeloma cylindrosporum]|uniref:Uncharacterized protein n=1 Tax=Hebeloma cylindrosporum TaxID=76867 RepID=A0A0C2YJD1_HEBCY|nr:hypothetical protein M413DRAFT_159352 [Hebeloma cylindrosporum h7]
MNSNVTKFELGNEPAGIRVGRSSLHGVSGFLAHVLLSQLISRCDGAQHQSTKPCYYLLPSLRLPLICLFSIFSQSCLPAFRSVVNLPVHHPNLLYDPVLGFLKIRESDFRSSTGLYSNHFPLYVNVPPAHRSTNSERMFPDPSQRQKANGYQDTCRRRHLFVSNDPAPQTAVYLCAHGASFDEFWTQVFRTLVNIKYQNEHQHTLQCRTATSINSAPRTAVYLNTLSSLPAVPWNST